MEEALVRGELGPGPTPLWLWLVQALSLWLPFRAFTRSFDRWLLRRRTEGEVSANDRGLLLRTRTQRLGRPAGEAIRAFPFEAVAELRLEEGGPPARLSVGLVAVLLGTAVGSGLVTEGLRAPGGAVELLALGLLLTLGGVGVDYALERGQFGRGTAPARLVLRARQGSGWVLRGVNPEAARRLLIAALQTAPVPASPGDPSIPAPASAE